MNRPENPLGGANSISSLSGRGEITNFPTKKMGERRGQRINSKSKGGGKIGYLGWYWKKGRIGGGILLSLRRGAMAFESDGGGGAAAYRKRP